MPWPRSTFSAQFPLPIWISFLHLHVRLFSLVCFASPPSPTSSSSAAAAAADEVYPPPATMMKDKMKDLMRKVTSASSSSSSSFKGTAHVLGSGPDSSSASSRHSNPSPSRPAAPRREAAATAAARPPSSGFAPYSPLISTSSRRASATTDPPAAGAGDAAAAAAACPSCAEPFPSELAVSDHLDGCLAAAGGARPRAAAYLAGDPPASAVEVVKRLLGNLLSDPRNDRYRKVRLGNPRIKEAVADREGGVDLLEAVGFRVADEGGELFAVMDEVPGDARLGGIRQAVLLLERARPSTPPQMQVDAKETRPNGVSEQQGIKKPVDRQIRVFFSVAASSVAENDLPDSFYSLSNEEIRNEAKMRRERLEQSRLLIPKSYKEKQALAARQKYKQALIRIQFPDGVILQGVFLPTEPISSLYEFAASALKQPSLEFDLICPAGPRTRVIPPFPKPGERARTLLDEDLVPSARLTFKPKETDSVVFTGLLDELLETSEPFTSASS